MEPSSIDVACVIPACNREATVGRAIESALAQTHPPSEVVVVDDGSTDATPERAASYGSPVRCVRQENRGAAAARNRGVRECSAEWVAFLDSDDYWLDGHLAALAEAIAATAGAADFYFANLRRPEGGGQILQWDMTGFSIPGPFELVEDATPWVLRPRIPMMLQSSAFHRQRFLAQGGLWEELRRRHDTHLFLKMGIGGAACAVANVGAQMTGDDGGGRLTAVMDPASRRYLEYSVMLWRDVLARFPELDATGRRLLRHRLLVSHLRLARLDVAALRLARGALHLARAFRASPPLFVRSALRARPSEAELLARSAPRGPGGPADRPAR